ncbi:MAG: Bug family tripartite tricarboxylate transporter substrate binding protein [Xanthobacteraceae bacterium]
MEIDRRKLIATSLSMLPILGTSGIAAHAQNYPARPVRLITDSAAGSAVDITTRIIAEGLSRVWGQEAVVVNQPGGGGAVAVHAAAAAAPDGYTLAVVSLSAFIAPSGRADDLPVQVPKDFAPVGYLTGGAMFITAASWLGVKTLPELIALAKKQPGKLSYGTNGSGRLTNLTGELLQERAGVELLMVPHSGGTAKILNDVMGKRIPILIDAYSGLAGAIEAGTIVPLAVASSKRLAKFPDVPTIAETLPGFEASGWQVLLAPARTPDSIVDKANADLNKALRDTKVQHRLEELVREIRPMSPAETEIFIQGEQKKWKPIVTRVSTAH